MNGLARQEAEERELTFTRRLLHWSQPLLRILREAIANTCPHKPSWCDVVVEAITASSATIPHGLAGVWHECARSQRKVRSDTEMIPVGRGSRDVPENQVLVPAPPLVYAGVVNAARCGKELENP